ncbi:hypothetical protein Thein_1822 [Thermodesulfatator indicus DSM 15286]|uniref:Uncharacterized protein n=1 Tax=Thermodesulfatator indicus (strain DSM 15286 / JCM 11887 / CIR29812) TaxID=667014 RepID=F8ABY5_THEID|nr:hypothetical protein [Thermodesulfatator indicus]AEH45677.1 hypothetical protein Thein_1822 [Thermodesulfatator indicus DSM 15286]
MPKIDDGKRSFIKKAIVVAGAVLALGSNKAKANKVKTGSQNEVLYRETETFRKYYETLRR